MSICETRGHNYLPIDLPIYPENPLFPVRLTELRHETLLYCRRCADVQQLPTYVGTTDFSVILTLSAIDEEELPE